MGRRNVLIEGVSGTGKTSVCAELRRRGLDAINGDTDLAYQGDPETGQPTEGFSHEHHIWDEARVREAAADPDAPATYFCGGSRNWGRFIDVFDAVVVLRIDEATLRARLGRRPTDEYGGTLEQLAHVVRLWETQEDVPDGIPIDATRPLAEVVDEIIRRTSG